MKKIRPRKQAESIYDLLALWTAKNGNTGHDPKHAGTCEAIVRFLFYCGDISSSTINKLLTDKEILWAAWRVWYQDVSFCEDETFPMRPAVKALLDKMLDAALLKTGPIWLVAEKLSILSILFPAYEGRILDLVRQGHIPVSGRFLNRFESRVAMEPSRISRMVPFDVEAMLIFFKYIQGTPFECSVAGWFSRVRQMPQRWWLNDTKFLCSLLSVLNDKVLRESLNILLQQDVDEKIRDAVHLALLESSVAAADLRAKSLAYHLNARSVEEITLGAGTCLPKEVEGAALCDMIINLEEMITNPSQLMGMPSEEEFKALTIELLLEGSNRSKYSSRLEGKELFDLAYRALRTLQKKTLSESSVVHDLQKDAVSCLAA